MKDRPWWRSSAPPPRGPGASRRSAPGRSCSPRRAFSTEARQHALVLVPEDGNRLPGRQVDRDAIYVRDGNVWTSAGVTSGMDLALALVEDDLGHEAALQVARFSVMYMMRPGGQSQFSAHLVAQRAEDPAINATLDFILANPGDPLTVTALAARAGLSERTFARRFKDETGMTPASYVETARVQAARVALETTAQRCRTDRDRRGVPERRTHAPGLPAASRRFRLGIPRAVSRIPRRGR
jgi:AraC-like DNA-binding protein